MKSALLQKNRIGEILGMLLESFTLVAPIKEDGILEFKEINSLIIKNSHNPGKDKINIINRVMDAIYSDELPYKSPKEILFPQVEALMAFDSGKDTVRCISHENTDVSENKTVIFGIRPCDLEAIKMLTTIFTGGKFRDERVARRRENIILVGVGCKEKKPGCFCDEVGIDKDFSENSDIFIQDEKLYSFTKLGDIVFDMLKTKEIISDPAMEDIQKMRGREGEPLVKKDLLDLGTNERLLFDDINWDRITEKCLGCGMCTYICPTCHCFDFKDVYEEGETIRYRRWDSCMYPKFTVHASGHNPRNSKKERFRQRVLHKYLYIKKNFGFVACTGCGRCIRNCPTGMNINSIVQEIMEALKSE